MIGLVLRGAESNPSELLSTNCAATCSDQGRMGHTIVNDHCITYSALQKCDARTALLFVLHCIFSIIVLLFCSLHIVKNLQSVIAMIV